MVQDDDESLKGDVEADETFVGGRPHAYEKAKAGHGTNRYATVDLETKRKAIAQAGEAADVASGLALWRTDASLLTWLEAL